MGNTCNVPAAGLLRKVPNKFNTVRIRRGARCVKKWLKDDTIDFKERTSSTAGKACIYEEAAGRA
jgi:hypothetical protein